LSSETYPASKQCNPWGTGKSTFVSVTTPTPSWTLADLTTIVDTSVWQVFQLPTGAIPMGLNFANSQIWQLTRGDKS